jgi:hypothetical protein
MKRILVLLATLLLSGLALAASPGAPLKGVDVKTPAADKADGDKAPADKAGADKAPQRKAGGKPLPKADEKSSAQHKAAGGSPPPQRKAGENPIEYLK